MSKNQPFCTFEPTKKLNLDRQGPRLPRQQRCSGTKLSQFAVPNVRRTYSQVKESRFARDQHPSREYTLVNCDFSDCSCREVSVITRSLSAAYQKIEANRFTGERCIVS